MTFLTGYGWVLMIDRANQRDVPRVSHNDIMIPLKPEGLHFEFERNFHVYRLNLQVDRNR